MIVCERYIWAAKKSPIDRMLKSAPSFVLAHERSSTYPRGYASGAFALRPCWRPLSICERYSHRGAGENGGFLNILRDRTKQ